MTIVASGEISLGGNATATRSVACEIDRSGTAAICMNESVVRTLAARTTAASAICMNDFYGKSYVPTALGQFYRGGYYGGTVASPANYYLLVAPNASGCAVCQWKTTNSVTGSCTNSDCNFNNGYWNTFTYLNNADHPAGNWTATRSINGFSDWYLPSRCELQLLYTNKSVMPTGQLWGSGNFFSSTGVFGNTAYGTRFSDGIGYAFSPVSTSRVRAIRRSPI